MVQRQLKVRLRRLVRKTRRFVVHGVLHADDPPHKLALGLAIGMFVTFTPTVGFQMVLTLFLSWLLRANKAVGLPVVWISNPATLIPIFYSCYVVGYILLGTEPVNLAWWDSIRHPPGGWWPAVEFYWRRLMEIAIPLWFGGLIIGLATGIPLYYLSLFAIRAYRFKRWGQLVPPQPGHRANQPGKAPESDRAADLADSRNSQ